MNSKSPKRTIPDDFMVCDGEKEKKKTKKNKGEDNKIVNKCETRKNLKRDFPSDSTDSDDDNRTGKIYKKNKEDDNEIIDNLCTSISNKAKVKEEAIIYARISTKNQKDGTSLDSQIDLCRNYCNNNNFEITGEIRTVCSGDKISPELKNIINNYSNINIIVYDVSRLIRCLIEGAKILKKCEENNITIIFVSENLFSSNNLHKGNIVANIMTAERELQEIRKRIRESVNYRRRNNISFSHVCKYGFKFDKNRVVIDNEDERKIINLIERLFFGDTFHNIDKRIIEITQNENDHIYWENYPDIEELFYRDMNNEDIANFLNKLEIYRRNKLWTKNSIGSIVKYIRLKYNRYHNRDCNRDKEDSESSSDIVPEENEENEELGESRDIYIGGDLDMDV